MNLPVDADEEVCRDEVAKRAHAQQNRRGVRGERVVYPFNVRLRERAVLEEVSGVDDDERDGGERRDVRERRAARETRARREDDERQRARDDEGSERNHRELRERRKARRSAEPESASKR